MKKQTKKNVLVQSLKQGRKPKLTTKGENDIPDVHKEHYKDSYIEDCNGVKTLKLSMYGELCLFQYVQSAVTYACCKSFDTVKLSSEVSDSKVYTNVFNEIDLAGKIRECQEECGKTYGYRRVHLWLKREEIYCNPKTVLRVMQKYNLLSVVRRKKYHYYSQALHKYPNLLNRDFKAERPNQKWVTDISYIHTHQGVLYLSVIRDLFDNSIVAYKTSTTQNVQLVLETIKVAKRKEKVTGDLQLHSDQGFQYTSNPYFKLTQSYNIIPSMSRRGNPYVAVKFL